MITRTITAFTLFISLLLSACGGQDKTAATDLSTARAVMISTTLAEVRDLPIWLETVGRAHSHSAPTLAAEVAGRVIQVSADTGERIEAGQLLAQTDTSTLLLQQQAAQAAIDRLQVHIANGERRVDRFASLSSKNLTSQAQLDDVKEQLEAFRADHKAAKAQLAIVNDAVAKSRVTAPVAGVIQQRFISEGDFVNRGQALFKITQPERLQAWLPYPESLALQVKVGQPAKLYSPLIEGELVSGKVTDLQPSIGIGSRAVMAIVNLDKPGNLRPEATLRGQVLVATHANAVMVPNKSIVRRPDGEVVYVIQNNTAEARNIITGQNRGAMIEIVAGLKGGEVVATDGASFLSNGANVSLAEPVR
jgi:RND family efflux transporter MFP subunit